MTNSKVQDIIEPVNQHEETDLSYWYCEDNIVAVRPKKRVFDTVKFCSVLLTVLAFVVAVPTLIIVVGG